MNSISTFFIGILGAFVVYVAIYRETRVMLAIRMPKKYIRLLIFDFFLYFICGGIVAVYLVQPVTVKEAFLGGATWNGITGGIITQCQLTADSIFGEKH